MLRLSEAEFRAMPFPYDPTMFWAGEFGCLIANFASCVFGIKDRETLTAAYNELRLGAHGKRLGWLLDTWENALMFMPYCNMNATAWEMCYFPYTTNRTGKVGPISVAEWHQYIKDEFLKALKESNLVEVI